MSETADNDGDHSLLDPLLSRLEGMAADDAIDLLRRRRSPAALCNPSFEAWLRAFRPGPPPGRYQIG